MSHTDKDRPYWVRVSDKLEGGGERHWCGYRYFLGSPYAYEYYPCDAHLPAPRTKAEYAERNCYPANPYRFWADVNPGWWTHVHQVVPRRRRDRDVLHDAIKWYRTDPESFIEDFDLGPSEPYDPWYW